MTQKMAYKAKMQPMEPNSYVAWRNCKRGKVHLVFIRKKKLSRGRAMPRRLSGAHTVRSFVPVFLFFFFLKSAASHLSQQNLSGMKALTRNKGFTVAGQATSEAAKRRRWGQNPRAYSKLVRESMKRFHLQKRHAQEERNTVQLIRRPEDRISRIGHETRAVVTRASDPMQRNRKTCESVSEGGRARRPRGKR